MSEDKNKDAQVRSVDKKLMEKEFVSLELKNECLATAIYEITLDKPFFGSVLQCMNIAYTHQIPTAGVAFNAEMKRWDLYINPYFFAVKLNNAKGISGKAARRAVLLHELYHIINKHPFRMPFAKIPEDKRVLANIAADMAINQYIKDLPAGCKDCKDQPPEYQCENELCAGKCINVNYYYDEINGQKVPWNKEQTMEFYYEKMLEKVKECQSKPDGSGKGEQGPGQFGKPIDVHNWDSAGEEKDMIEATEDLVKRAMIKNKFGYDDVPGSVRELLEDLKQRKAQLNYKALILQAIKKSATGAERKHTWSRKSKRYGNFAPGTKEGDLPKLNMFIDTSGSISIEEANSFLDIVDNFLKAGSRKCRLNMFHTENYYNSEYKLGQRIKKEEIQSGGTDLTASLKEIFTRKSDLAIFLTDGYYGDVLVEQWMKANDHFPECLFIISKSGEENHPLKRLGKTIKIPA